MLSRVVQKSVGHKFVILIGASEAARLIAAGAAVLDANPPQRWRAIHVPGSRNVDLARCGREELPFDPATLVIF
jgi:hypothetical protein